MTWHHTITTISLLCPTISLSFPTISLSYGYICWNHGTAVPSYLFNKLVVMTVYHNIQLYHYYLQLYHYYVQLYHYSTVIFAWIMEPQCQVTCSWSYTIQPILHHCRINHPTQCWSHLVMVGHTWSWMVTLGHSRSHAHAHDVRCMMFKDRVSSHSASRLL